MIVHVHHYPPGTSKWNKIEHRLFCHITQTWRGRPLTDRLAVVELIAATTTTTRLRVKMAERGQITGAVLDGPLALDNAISPEAAAIKKIASPVAGRANILVVPDLEAGNMLAKSLTFLADADAAGIVLWARVPIILTSRADSQLTRSTPSGLPKPGSSLPSEASATPTPSPKRSTASTRPRSSIVAHRGATSRPSSSQPSSGWTGSTIAGFWSPSASSRRPKPRNATSPC